MFVIFERKTFYNKAISLLLYSFLFFGTIHAVWFAHKKAFVKGGVVKKEFMRQMYHKFFKSLQFLHASDKQETRQDAGAKGLWSNLAFTPGRGNGL